MHKFIGNVTFLESVYGCPTIYQQNLTHYTLYTHDTCHMLTDQSAWRSFLYMQQTIDIPNAVDEAWYWLKHIIVHL